MSTRWKLWCAFNLDEIILHQPVCPPTPFKIKMLTFRGEGTMAACCSEEPMLGSKWDPAAASRVIIGAALPAGDTDGAAAWCIRGAPSRRLAGVG